MSCSFVYRIVLGVCKGYNIHHARSNSGLIWSTEITLVHFNIYLLLLAFIRSLCTIKNSVNTHSFHA